MAPLKKPARVSSASAGASPADRQAAKTDLLLARRDEIERELEQLQRPAELVDVVDVEPLRIANFLQFGAQAFALVIVLIFWVAAAVMRDHLRRFHPESLAAKETEVEQAVAS